MAEAGGAALRGNVTDGTANATPKDTFVFSFRGKQEGERQEKRKGSDDLCQMRGFDCPVPRKCFVGRRSGWILPNPSGDLMCSCEG